MVNTRNLEDSNSQIEILDRVSEVNIYTILSDYNKSKPGVTVECDSYNSEKAVEVPYFGEVKEFFYLADKFMVFEDKEYLHLINVNKLSAVVIKSDI